MARWEPGAYERLREAALMLFDEQGFEKTTVAQIAERAGLNRRTFFHHFADKREVLFAGEDAVPPVITTFLPSYLPMSAVLLDIVPGGDIKSKLQVPGLSKTRIATRHARAA